MSWESDLRQAVAQDYQQNMDAQTDAYADDLPF